MAKTKMPQMPVVFGGPCVDDTDPEILALLKKATAMDFAVPGEGEVGFVHLISALGIGKAREGVIPGVAYLGNAGQMVRGTYIRPIGPQSKDMLESQDSKLHVEIQSPYLDGTLDTFLDEGMVPIIQTMRGCPYGCHFCVSGSTNWNKLRGFPVERVKAEVDYALSRSKATDLILTDENWGVLGERDVEIARFLMDRFHAKKSPTRLYYYTAKVVKDASREIIELVTPIAWIGEFSLSFQSLNPQTRDAIKRTNITLAQLGSNIEWAKGKDILTSSEMIYGFPYETPATFIDGVETLMNAGMSKVQIYPLQLFPGIDLDSSEARDKFGLKTRFRLADAGYGIYQNGKMVSTEVEEIVVGTNWSDFGDYLTVRRYAFFLMVFFGREYLVELSRLCDEAKISAVSISRYMTLTDYTNQPALQGILAEYNQDAAGELQENREAVNALVSARLLKGEDVSGVKLNLIYLGKIFSYQTAIGELFGMIENYFESLLAGNVHREVVMSYVREILPNRIVELNAEVHAIVEFQSRFNYPKWLSRDYENVSELLLSEPQHYIGTVADVLIKNLVGFNSTRASDLQGIYDKTRSQYLMRAVIGA